MTATTNKIRFMTDNYAAGSGATVTASSSLTSFPVSNVVDSRRFNQWLPNGNFTIDTTNRFFGYNDGTASRSFNITTGDYSTPDALATQIQTQLNAQSTATWTVTYNSTTNKFELTSDNAGSYLRDSTVFTAWPMLGFTHSGSTSAGTTFEADEIRIHTDEWIKVDLAVATEIDFVALIGPLNEDFTVSQAGTVTIEANSSDSWTSPPFSVSLSLDTFGAMEFLDSEATRTYRYWRVKIVDPTNPLGPNGLVFGHLYVGSYTTLTSATVEQGFNVTQVDPSIVVASENGARFFNQRTNFIDWTNMQITYPDAAERRTLQQLFYDLGTFTPFYVSIDPMLEVSAEYQEYTRYVTFTKTPVFNHIYRDYYTIVMDMREVS